MANKSSRSSWKVLVLWPYIKNRVAELPGKCTIILHHNCIIILKQWHLMNYVHNMFKVTGYILHIIQVLWQVSTVCKPLDLSSGQGIQCINESGGLARKRQMKKNKNKTNAWTCTSFMYLTMLSKVYSNSLIDCSRYWDYSNIFATQFTLHCLVTKSFFQE